MGTSGHRGAQAPCGWASAFGAGFVGVLLPGLPCGRARAGPGSQAADTRVHRGSRAGGDLAGPRLRGSLGSSGCSRADAGGDRVSPPLGPVAAPPCHGRGGVGACAREEGRWGMACLRRVLSDSRGGTESDLRFEVSVRWRGGHSTGGFCRWEMLTPLKTASMPAGPLGAGAWAAGLGTSPLCVGPLASGSRSQRLGELGLHVTACSPRASAHVHTIALSPPPACPSRLSWPRKSLGPSGVSHTVSHLLAA